MEAMDKETGRALWKKLHDKAALYQGELTDSQRHEIRAWMDQFDGLVGRAEAGCRCAPHWRIIRWRYPLDLRSGTSFLHWTQVVHDVVNARLGKPLWLPSQQPQMLQSSGETSSS